MVGRSLWPFALPWMQCHLSITGRTTTRSRYTQALPNVCTVRLNEVPGFISVDPCYIPLEKNIYIHITQHHREKNTIFNLHHSSWMQKNKLPTNKTPCKWFCTKTSSTVCSVQINVTEPDISIKIFLLILHIPNLFVCFP